MATIATVQVFDFEQYTGDPTLTSPAVAVGVPITAQLSFNQINAVSPQVNLQAVRVSTVTDATGRWQLNLVPNGNINPAGTLYTITTPTKVYQISVPASGPVQSTSIMVNAPISLAPVTSTTGPLTVQGALTAQGLITGQAGLTIAGAVNLPAASVGVAALSGILSIANGGTGSATQNFVDINTAQGIGGNKTFLNNIIASSHLLGTGTAPTLGALQTNVTAQSIGGNDVRGIVAITAGGTPPGIGAVVAVVNFNGVFGVTPIVMITDQGNVATTNSFVARAVSVNGFSIMVSGGGVALAAGVTYSIGFVVIG